MAILEEDSERRSERRYDLGSESRESWTEHGVGKGAISGEAVAGRLVIQGNQVACEEQLQWC